MANNLTQVQDIRIADKFLESFVVAMRYLQPIVREAYIEASPVSDPSTGITLGYRRYYDTDSGKMIAAFECVYGFRKAIAAGIKRIVSVTL